MIILQQKIAQRNAVVAASTLHTQERYKHIQIFKLGEKSSTKGRNKKGNNYFYKEDMLQSFFRAANVIISIAD